MKKQRALLPSILLLMSVAGNASATAPDFRQYNVVKEKKQAFFSYLLPFAKKANSDVLASRRKILSLQKTTSLSNADKLWLTSTMKKYAVKTTTDGVPFKSLLKRVDAVPTALVLAQAANESAWGTSKFARLGNNYFGQWCFTKHCGLVPARRDKSKTHEVQTFSSAFESVQSYILNINRNSNYAALRDIRAHLRQQDKPLLGATLASGLSKYSERGNDYILEIKAMIRMNHLDDTVSANIA